MLADLGPALLAATLVALGVGLYVAWQTGRRTARWPLAVCALLVGWIPIAQGGRSGLLGVSGGVAFLAMWWTTRRTARVARPRLPGTPRVRLALLAALTAILAGASASYAVFHPVHASFASATHVTLRDGRSDRAFLALHGEGPLAARVLDVALADAPALRVARLERDGPGTEGPTPDSLYSPLGAPRLAPGGSLDAALTLAGPAHCAETVRALAVRLAVAGAERTQRVPLAEPLRVVCRTSKRR